jgi:CheY-like chemotaxis protein
MATQTDRYNVLIVDDHESTRLLVGCIVSQELGARVTLAGTCEEALHRAAESTYDAVLLDLLMPGIGGYEVLRKIREHGANRTTPILVLSVMSTRESIERCRRLGATAFVAKPVDRELIATALRSVLAQESAASATADGALVGPQAEGMFTSFVLSAAGKTFSGAALLSG